MPEESRYTGRIDREQIYNEYISMKVFCHAHPLSALRPSLYKDNIIKATDLRRLPTGSIVRVVGLLIIVHTPPTKSGKRVMFLTMEDETGLMDVVVFPKTQKGFARTILTSQVLAVQGKLQKQGVGGKSMSIIMEKAIKNWSGNLHDFLRIQIESNPS